jgi:hypothetical protein
VRGVAGVLWMCCAAASILPPRSPAISSDLQRAFILLPGSHPPGRSPRCPSIELTTRAQSCTAIYVLKRRTVFRNLRRAERHYHCSCPGRNTAPILAFTGEAPEQIQRVQSFYQSRHHRCAVTLIVGYRSCPVDGEGRDDTGPTLATSMGSIRTCE